MIKTPLLEVTEIEPRYKHSTIFDHFDALDAGESFVIRNDHDPKPLYYQLIGERGNVFTWDYLESGPSYWQVRIGKLNLDEEPETVGTIAAKDIRKAMLLKDLGIDFSGGGKQTIKEAATSIGFTENDLRSKLQNIDTNVPSAINFDYASWDSDFLSDYIKNIHHKYVKEKGPLIEFLAEKVAIAHASQYPELDELTTDIHALMNNLLKQLDKEEVQLFPATKNFNSLTKEQIQQLVDYFVMENDNTGKSLKHLRKITNDYSLPINACHSYTYLFEQLKAFEADLLQKIHLENNILFPKMIKAHS